jgi:hypothetical protein
MDQIARAIMYEGYLLYPYRLSALKNQKRWTFGCLFPPAYCAAQEGGEASFMQTECLLRGSEATILEATVRFLQVQGQEAVERRVTPPPQRLTDLALAAHTFPFTFPRLQGFAESSVEPVGDGVYRLRTRVENRTPLDGPLPEAREDALPYAFVSALSVLSLRDGEFLSLIDPPEGVRELAAVCRNVGTWPVLVGAPGQTDQMLAAPIILYDYPQLAPESPGEFFDSSEIDELLTLRVATLAEQERREVLAGDEHGRAILSRSETLDLSGLQKLHGAVRAWRPVEQTGTLAPTPQAGERVRLRPLGGADILDVALVGKTATVVALEEDMEGRVYVVVTVDDDPGRDLGAQGKPGHRFFFRPDEIEPLAP